MASSIRQLAKSVVPKPLLVSSWAAYCRRKAAAARRAFDEAGTEPAWLGWDELDALQRHYPLRPMTYKYDDQSLEERGRQRAAEMLSLVKADRATLPRWLDLGMWDGMACYALQQEGLQATGVDIRVSGLTDKARGSGAWFAGMDARAMGFAANSFDFVFSYNSFEHFPDPEQVLRQATRVARPGGYIYLNFGPLWLSPRGAHQFQTISVPYVECLFTKEMLTAYTEANGIRLMGYFWMNEWPLQRYRDLWDRMAGELERVAYFEVYNADAVELIERYPSCFRSKTNHFDDLIVSNIEVLFRKR